MKWWGFKRGIFEDNFPVGEGDSYSLKQIINNTGHPNIQLSEKYLPKRKKEMKKLLLEESILNKYYFRQNMIVRPNKVDHSGLKINLKNMIEFPPIYTTEVSYWGEAWSDNYAKLDNLINKENIDNFPKFKAFLKDNPNKFDYGFLTYLELDF